MLQTFELRRQTKMEKKIVFIVLKFKLRNKYQRKRNPEKLRFHTIFCDLLLVLHIRGNSRQPADYRGCNPRT